jgi:hypothetical protein
MAWPYIIVMVASALISAGISYYQSRQTEDAPDRDPLDDGSIPRVTESDPIPVVFGSPILRAPNVVWWAQRPDDGTEENPIGRVRMLMAVCQGPVDELLIYLDDQRCTGDGGPVWDLTGGIVHVDTGDIGVEAPATNPAGGVSELDSGFLRDVYLMPGQPDQDLPAAIATSMDIGPQPSYRGVLSIYGLFHFDSGRRQIKPISFIPVRIGQRSFGDTQWEPSRAQIGARQMNPAHIIREILTDAQWGAGEPEILIDEDSFLAAAITLQSEGFGLSVAWAQPSDYTGLLAEVERHIDGSIYQERTTGKYILRLVRDDFDVDELPVFGPDQIRGLSWTRPAAWQLVNEVVVKFRTYGQVSEGRSYIIDRERTVQAADSASQLLRGVVADTIDYPFVYTPALAQRLAARDLLQLGQPLASVRLELAPSVGRDLRPTDLFIIEDEGRGIPRMVVRVVSQVEQTHEGRDAGVIVEAIEDAFAFSQRLSSAGPDIAIGDPLRPDVPDVEALELPFYLSHAFATESTPYATLADTAARERGLVAMVAFGTDETTQRWDMSARSSALPRRLPEVNATIAPQITVAFTGSGINYEGGSVDFVTDVADRDFTLAEDERLLVYLPDVADDFSSFPQIVSIDPTSATTGTMEIGLFDTVTPVVFPNETSGIILGAVIWGVEPQIRRLYAVDGRLYVKDVEVTLEAITRIGASRLIDGIPSEDVEIDLRAQKPYAPGALVVTPVDDKVDPDGYVQISWKRRARGAQRLQTDADVDDFLDPGRTIEVDIYATTSALDTFTLLRTVTGLTGLFYDYENKDELRDTGGRLEPALLFVVRSKRDGFDSLYGNTRVYIRT